jgi:hypothetical protein
MWSDSSAASNQSERPRREIGGFGARLTPGEDFRGVPTLRFQGFAAKKGAKGGFFTCNINYLRAKMRRTRGGSEFGD